MPVVHVKTTKGNGWEPADGAPVPPALLLRLRPRDRRGPRDAAAGPGYQDVAAAVVGERDAQRDDSVVCITPSTLYATGLAPVFEAFPERCFDPGMEEQHA